MRFALMTEPQQGLTYEEIQAVALAAEESGFESFFRSDHFASFPGEAGLPTTDCWSTLAGLARDTSRIGLGSLVSPVTFRIPGVFAKVAMTVDEMSGGRVEAGVGAGWNDLEHAQLGIPFPAPKERVDMLEEELRILHGLWDEPAGWSFEGAHWQVKDARTNPRRRPAAGRLPIIVGGTGKPRSVRLGGRWADEYNVSSTAPDGFRRINAQLDAACGDAGRDPSTLVRSAMAGVLVAETESQLRDRVADQLAAFGEGGDTDAEAWLAERRARWVIGTPDQARARVAEFEAAGVERIMLQDFLPRDLDMVRLLGRELIA